MANPCLACFFCLCHVSGLELFFFLHKVLRALLGRFKVLAWTEVGDGAGGTLQMKHCRRALGRHIAFLQWPAPYSNLDEVESVQVLWDRHLIYDDLN